MSQNVDGALGFVANIDISNFQASIDAMNRSIRNTANIAVSESGRMDMSFKRLGTYIGGYFSVQAIRGFSAELIKVRGEIQMLETSFDVLLGGKGVSGFMSELKQFAVDSPLSLSGVSNAAQTLLGFGVTAEKVIPTIKQIGDISMGNEERFRSLSLAFAQMSATGRLMGQDLLQMINAGFNPLQIISEKTGKSIRDLKKEMESGAISSEMVADAFASATAEGGKFYGMTQKQAEGIRGLQAQLEGGLQDAFNNVGKSQEGLIVGGYKVAISLVENYETIGKALTALIATYGVYKAAMVMTTAIDRTMTVARYNAEIAELSKLISLKELEANADLKSAVASGKLTSEKAAQIAVLRAEIESRRESIQSKLAEEQANLKALFARRAEAKEALEFARAKTAAAKEELSNAITTAQAEFESSLRKKMAIESEKQSRTALRIVKLQEQKDAAIEQARILKENQASAEKIAAKHREIAAIQAKIVAAREEEIQHGRNVAAARAEIKAGVDITANKNIQTLSNKVNTLSEQENTAAIAHNGLIKKTVSGKILIKKIATDAETASTQINTATTNANTVSTNYLVIAKNRLITASKNLLSVIAPNPYMFTAAAAVALGYGIYKLATYQTESEKAQSRLNDAMKESEKASLSETRELARLKGELSAATKGSDEYNRIKEKIISNYGKYHKGLEEEIEKVGLLDSTYKKLTESIQASFSARQYEKFKQDESDNLDEVMSKNLGKIQDRLIDKLGDEAGAKYYAKIREAIFNKNVSVDNAFNTTGLDRETQAAIDKISGKADNDWYQNHAIESYIKNIIVAQQLTDDLDKKARMKFGIDPSANTDSGSEDPASPQKYGEAYREAKKEWEAAKKALLDIEKDKDKFTKEQYDNAKKREDAAKKAYSDLGGVTKSEKVSTSKPKDYTDQLKREEQERIRLNKDMEFAVSQAEIDAMSDGMNKTLAQNKLNYDKEIEQIKRQKEDKLKKIQDWERTIWESQNPDWERKGMKFTPTTTQLSDEENSQFGVIEEATIKNLEAANKEVINNLVNEYGDYYKKRALLAETWEQKIAGIPVEHQSEARDQMQRELNDLYDDYIKTTTAISGLFGDMSERTVAEMRNIASQAQSMVDFVVAGVWDEEKAAAYGIKTEDQFKKLNAEWTNSPEKIDAINDSIDKLSRTTDEADTALNKMSAGLKKVFSSGNDQKKLKEGLGNISDGLQSVTEMGDMFANSLRNIGELSDSDVFGQLADGLSSVMDVANQTMQGAQAGAAFGPIGAAVGAALGLVSSITDALASGREMAKKNAELTQQMLLQAFIGEKEVNKLYRERYDWSQRIGESNLDYAERVGEELRKQRAEAERDADEVWNKLQNSTAKTTWDDGKRGSGIFDPFVKDTYASWTGAESLKGKTLKEIEALYYGTGGELSDEARRLYEYWLSLNDEVKDIQAREEEARAKEWEAITGTTRSGIVDGIIDGFKAGKRSAADFADTFEDMMSDAVASSLQMAADKRMVEFYEKFARMSDDADGLTENDIEHLNDLWNSIITGISDEAERLERITGMKLGDEYIEDPLTGAARGMSEETGSLVAGKLNAAIINQGNTIEVLRESLIYQQEIALNTRYNRHLEQIANSLKRIEEKESSMLPYGVT